MTTITLAPTPAGTPAPFIEVTVDDIDGGVDRVTVWRFQRDRQFRVRGLVSVSAGGTVNARDFEAPFGVESTYRVEQFDSSGDFVSWSTTESVTLTAPDDASTAWWHNPFDPTTSVAVTMIRPDTRTLSRPIDADTFKVAGRSVGVTVFNGPRRGYEQLVLDCYTTTDGDASKFDALFGGYDADTIPIVCVRTHPTFRIPGTLFALAQVGMGPRDRATDEIVDWTVTADEVSPPPEAVFVALLDYADFTAFYTDYAEFTAAYTDYREAQLDYSIAGTA